MAASTMLRYFLTILITVNLAVGHIPVEKYTWAEPDADEYVAYDASLNSVHDASTRLTAVRAAMSAAGVDAYVIPTADAHNSQYISPADARRVWVSGLQGSSGTVVVAMDVALVWTDARYWTQFDMQVDREQFGLMRQGIDLSIQSWLVQNMTSGSSVGVDPTTYTRSAWNTLQNALSAVNVNLVATPNNLVDEARRNLTDGPPARPNQPLIPLGVEWTGRRSSDKITELMGQMASRGVSALVLSALDDIAYTLNVRGSDIPFNPVFFSYLILRSDVSTSNRVNLFWGNGLVATDIAAHWATEGTEVQVRPYVEIISYLENELANNLPNGSSVWLSQDASHALFSAVESNENLNILSTLSPVQLIKCIKNEVELRGFRSAHVKDGIAVVRAFRWLEDELAAGVNVTEIDLSDKMAELRWAEEESHGPSFSTIAGAGEHGAVIHYSPSRDGPQRVIGRDDMLLVDSGGQYKDGTTDITRTRHMSASPTPAQRLTFTRVMKGQIQLATTVFPRGTVGHTLESFARKYLWDVGLNYGHGTGHGVGHFLNVHEGPSWILSGPSATDPGISAGMIFSNEPGYYEVGEYGVRHEDLVEVIVVNRTADHIFADGMVGDFEGVGALGFYTISLVPHQTACLDVSLLSDLEIKYINEYHARVLSTLGPVLQSRGLDEDYAWLVRECAPIRSAAILKTSAPFLIVSVITLWFNIA